MFTVGPFGRLAGVSAKLLRAYDAAGLFRPAWVDPSSAYRYYSTAQLPELRRILALRDVGMPLAEIGRLVAGGDDLRSALERRRADLERERREVDRRLARLEIDVRLADAGEAAPDVVVRRIPAELVASIELDLRVDADIGAAFREIEGYVRERDRRAHRPPGLVEPGPNSATVFVPITRTVPGTDRITSRRLPVTRAATLLHRGPYTSLEEGRDALAAWVEAAGLQPDGPMRILYLQFGAEPGLRVPDGWVVTRAADYVTELQLPVA